MTTPDTLSHWTGCCCAGCGAGLNYVLNESADAYVLEGFDQNVEPAAATSASFTTELVDPADAQSGGFAYSLNIVDVSGQGAEFIDDVEAVMTAVMDRWGDFITGLGRLDLRIEIESFADDPNVSGTVLASAGPTSVPFERFDDGVRVFEPGSIRELQTGRDPNGNAADGIINIGLEFLQQFAFIDTDPQPGDIVPPEQIDLYSVLLHEVLHILGFIGIRDPETFELEFPPDGTTFDALVELDDLGLPTFVGEATSDLYGAAAPVESSRGRGSNIYHFGDEGGPREDLTNALMSAAIEFGERDVIGALELALLRDLGLDVVIPNDIPLVDFRDGGLTPTVIVEPDLIDVEAESPSFTISRDGLASGLPSVGYEVTAVDSETGLGASIDRDRFVFVPQTLTGEVALEIGDVAAVPGADRLDIELFYPANSATPSNALVETFSVDLVGELPEVGNDLTLETPDVFRFFNSETGAHFYTASLEERDAILEALPNFAFEGIVFEAAAPDALNAIPVYRFLNRVTGVHVFTSFPDEAQAFADDNFYRSEGIAFFVLSERTPGSVPATRFRNTNGASDVFFYTISGEERSAVSATEGFINQGQPFQVFPVGFDSPIGLVSDPIEDLTLI